MKTKPPIYHGYHFPPEVLSHAIWLYHRLCLSVREVENPLAELGITDELFLTVHGQRQYLWRAVDQDGDVIDILALRT